MVDKNSALYQWVASNEAVLVNAAERVFKYALSDHMRLKDQERINHLSAGWIRNIKYQMELDEFHLTIESPETRRRGRPRKQIQIIPPNAPAESSTMAQTRSQNKNVRNMTAIDSLFSQPCVTTSPKKDNQKVIRLIRFLRTGLTL